MTACYSISKLAMGLLTAAWSAEFPFAHFNTIWPQHAVATFALTNTFQEDLRRTVTVAHVADPAYRIVTSSLRASFCKDTDVLACMGVSNASAWRVDSSRSDTLKDFMIDPVGLKEGQRIEYIPLPDAHLPNSSMLQKVLLAGGPITVEMRGLGIAAGASVITTQLTADVLSIESGMANVGMLDAMFVGAAPASSLSTLQMTSNEWDELFGLQCKALNFSVVKALPALRRGEQPRILVVAQAPMCHPDNLVHPAVPCAIIAQLRGMYIIGMNGRVW